MYEFVRNVTAFLLFETVAMHLVEQSTYKKYLKFFFGIVLILILVGPLLKLFGVNLRFDRYLDSWNLQTENEEMRGRLETAEEESRKDLIAGYEEAAWSTIESYAQSYGWYVSDGSLAYGENMEITGVEITLSYYAAEAAETEGSKTEAEEGVTIGEIAEVEQIEIDRIYYDSESYRQIEDYKEGGNDLFKGREKELESFRREISLLLGIPVDAVNVRTSKD